MEVAPFDLLIIFTRSEGPHPNKLYKLLSNIFYKIPHIRELENCIYLQ